MNRNSLATGLSAFVASLLIASTAFAGPLGSDPTGMAGFTGTASYNAANALLVDLDYAVFAPGVYPDDGINGDDPSNGTEYVYAYQAFGLAGSVPMSTVTIGLLEPFGANNAMADPAHVMTGGVLPMFSIVLPNSVVTDFSFPPVVAGGYSSVFLFTSPVPPTWVGGSVVGGGWGDLQMVPSPLPEPSTLGLLAVAGLMILRRRHP